MCQRCEMEEVSSVKMLDANRAKESDKDNGSLNVKDQLKNYFNTSTLKISIILNHWKALRFFRKR